MPPTVVGPIRPVPLMEALTIPRRVVIKQDNYSVALPIWAVDNENADPDGLRIELTFSCEGFPQEVKYELEVKDVP